MVDLSGSPRGAFVPKKGFLMMRLWGLVVFSLFVFEHPSAAAVIEPKALVHRVGCTNCHDMSRKLLGPSFMDVSRRYLNQRGDVTALLQDRIRDGSQDRWGTGSIMPAQPGLKGEELGQVVQWILNLTKQEHR